MTRLTDAENDFRNRQLKVDMQQANLQLETLQQNVNRMTDRQINIAEVLEERQA